MAFDFNMQGLNHSSIQCATTVQPQSLTIATMVEKDYSARLQEAMSAKGMSTQALADAMGISYQAVRKVLIGLTKAFSAEHNSKAAEILGVNPDWLATGRPKSPAKAPPVLEAREPTPRFETPYWPFSTPIDVFRRTVTAEDIEKLNHFIEICVRSASGSSKSAARA